MTTTKRYRRGKRTHGVKRIGKWLALLPATCILLYPLYLAAQLDLVESTRVCAGLPGVFNGLRIAYLSDIHFGALLSEDRVRQIVSRVNDLNADLVLLGGDYSEDSAGAIRFFELNPGFSAKYGVFAIVGNHDRTTPESNLQRMTRAMRNAGVTPLVNEAALLRGGDHTLALAGIDDFYNGHPDYERVKRMCESADFTVFLPHTPDAVPEALAGGKWFDLALCGHTHGGQVTVLGFPFVSSSIYGKKYLSGWMDIDGVPTLVSNGVGTSGLPVRLGARPQMHLITLRSQ